MPSSSSIIGISNLPNQRHKIASRNIQDYTILVVGQGGTFNSFLIISYNTLNYQGLGKTTFINTLFQTQIVTRRENLTDKLTIQQTNVICEENGFQVRLNIVDCKGYFNSISFITYFTHSVNYLVYAM